jgi:hypothetical protein
VECLASPVSQVYEKREINIVLRTFHECSARLSHPGDNIRGNRKIRHNIEPPGNKQVWLDDSVKGQVMLP